MTHIEGFRNLKFDDLHNTLYIKNKVISIPEMDLNSNVMNFTLQGTQNFDNYMNFRVKANARHLLYGKKVIDSTIVTPTLVNNKPGLMVNFTLIGDSKHPKVKLDKRTLRKDISQDLSKKINKPLNKLSKLFKKKH